MGYNPWLYMGYANLLHLAVVTTRVTFWLFPIAMENHHAIKNGKPSISMGDGFRGELLVITRGFLGRFLGRKAFAQKQGIGHHGLKARVADSRNGFGVVEVHVLRCRGVHRTLI